MNLIVIATFFNKTYIAIFYHLLAVEFIEGELFSLVLTHFRIIEINKRGIFYFHCLVWLIKKQICFIFEKNFMMILVILANFFISLITSLVSIYWSIFLTFFSSKLKLG